MIIEKYFCLNLDSRPDRWEESVAEFEKQGITVERIAGVPGSFNLGYVKALQAAAPYKSSLIFEDDVEFIGEWKPALSELPTDWDCVFLGANLNRVHKKKYSTHLYQYEDGWATQSVGYSQSMISYILDHFDPHGGTIYDEWLRVNILPYFKCYVVCPLATMQRPSFSDIRNRFVDYSELLKKNYFE